MCHFFPGGGGVLHYGWDGDVRQFWVVFGLKILGLGYPFTGKFLWLGYTFTRNFLGLGYTQNSAMGVEWKYNWINFRATRGQFQVNWFQVFLCWKTSSDQNLVPIWPLGTKIIVPSPQSLIPLTSNYFCYFFDWVSISDIYSGIGYQYRTKFLGLGRNRNPCGAHPRMNL